MLLCDWKNRLNLKIILESHLKLRVNIILEDNLDLFKINERNLVLMILYDFIYLWNFGKSRCNNDNGFALVLLTLDLS